MCPNTPLKNQPGGITQKRYTKKKAQRLETSGKIESRAKLPGKPQGKHSTQYEKSTCLIPNMVAISTTPMPEGTTKALVLYFGKKVASVAKVQKRLSLFYFPVFDYFLSTDSYAYE